MDEPVDSVAVLDKLFTSALLEVKIVQNSMAEVKAYSEDQSQLKKDRIFELDLYEMVLYDEYLKYKTILEASTERVRDIRKLRKAKEVIDSGRITVINANDSEETISAIEDHKELLE